MTTLTALDISPAVVEFRKPARTIIREALTPTCERLGLSSIQVEAVVDTANAARQINGASIAMACEEGRKTAYRIAEKTQARRAQFPRRFPEPPIGAA